MKDIMIVMTNVKKLKGYEYFKALYVKILFYFLYHNKGTKKP